MLFQIIAGTNTWSFVAAKAALDQLRKLWKVPQAKLAHKDDIHSQVITNLQLILDALASEPKGDPTWAMLNDVRIDLLLPCLARAFLPSDCCASMVPFVDTPEYS
jgi:hypothetical protein